MFVKEPIKTRVEFPNHKIEKGNIYIIIKSLDRSIPDYEPDHESGYEPDNEPDY